jgi:hypothetical protein
MTVERKLRLSHGFSVETNEQLEPENSVWNQIVKKIGIIIIN